MSGPIRHFVFAITGASGALYARRLVQCLAQTEDIHTHLVISPYGKLLLSDELGIERPTIEALTGFPTDRVTLYNYQDVGCRLASGSFLTSGMVVCPCSSNTLGEIAAGLGGNLISRAAAVTLKESRRLILVLRESPMSQIELRNALRLSEAGAVICPASPGFYMHPRSIDDLADFMTGKILDLLGIAHALGTRWQNPESGS